MRKYSIILIAILALLISSSTNYAAKQTKSPIKFYDAKKQAAEFITYYNTITLTPAQERIKKEALSPIPAPCCGSYSVATCCCPCNLAKAVWGLTHFLIAKKEMTATEVRGVVQDWLKFTNPSGYAGNACFTGGCSRPFEKDGCGGMNEKQIS